MTDTPKTMEVTNELLALMRSAIRAALAYEVATGGRRLRHPNPEGERRERSPRAFSAAAGRPEAGRRRWRRLSLDRSCARACRNRQWDYHKKWCHVRG